MKINSRLLRALSLSIVIDTGGSVGPGQAQEAEELVETEESPWLLVPMITSDPKLGNSLGLTGGYIHQFDPGSTPSMFLVHTSYSDTDSRISGLFGQMYFDSDRQKLILGLVDGRIENDYEDFLGSGIPAQTTDNLDAEFARYYHVVSGDWYAGFQLVSSNYVIGAEGFFEDFLEFIGLTGFDSTGLGLAVEYDTRDNQRNPSTGKHFQVNNLAYRESLGGDESFDVYRVEYSEYINFKKIMFSPGRSWADGPTMRRLAAIRRSNCAATFAAITWRLTTPTPRSRIVSASPSAGECRFLVAWPVFTAQSRTARVAIIYTLPSAPASF
ncbi:MAG: hypothetical protein GY785_03215 [Gammaproteobacteria bacterium]|nr:hypothetical protein [Gammaproteobacteria bacterium]